MIIKHKDNREEDIQELNHLLTLALTNNQRFLVERELKCLKAGERNEETSAYYMNFAYKDEKNWALLHDLRIEHRGRVAQIDHMLINRFMEIYVLESKSYYYGVKITENGEFMVWNGKSYHGIESPIEQNKRHIDVLSQAIEDRKLAPERLGISLPVRCISYVLVAPNANIERPPHKRLNTDFVIKADALVSAVEKENESINPAGLVGVLKTIGQDTLQSFAERVARLHRPGKYDYAAKFGIVTKEAAVSPTVAEEAAHYNSPKNNGHCCDKCGGSVDDKVVFFCRLNKQKLAGQLLCRKCQQAMEAKAAPIVVETPIHYDTPKNNSHCCDKCDCTLDDKIVFFCRMNKQKFGGRLLCRRCQQAAGAS